MRTFKLEHKVFLIIVATLVCGLGLSVLIPIKRESDSLEREYRHRSLLFGETLMTGFRNVMLSGRAGYVKQLVSEAREKFQAFGELQLFDNRGEEIFAAEGPFLSGVADDPRVDAVLASHQPHSFDHTRITPLLNEGRCQACHGDGAPVRGASLLSLRTPTSATGPRMATGILAAAFEQIMVSGQGELADTLLTDAASIPRVRFAQVYDSAGYYPAFGDVDLEVDEAALAEAVTRFSADPVATPLAAESDGMTQIFVGLPNEERCYVCHGDDHRLRGILAVAFDARAGNDADLVVAQESFATGFRSMMLVESGTHSGHFVEEVRSLPYVEQARLFTPTKSRSIELYIPNRTPQTPVDSVVDSVRSMIRQVNLAEPVEKMEPRVFIDERDTGAFLVQIKPIENEVRCQVCHAPPEPGSPQYDSLQDRWKVRTVVAISSPLDPIHEQIDRNKRVSVIIGIGPLLFVWVILRLFMKQLVIKPIAAIGETANQIGSGNLQARTQITSGDELGRLAGEINDMANGLRERFELTKFVSGETLDAVRLNEEGVQLGGERKLRTLFFSDIRGFTAYSEKVEPEQVISMLNTYLREQSYIVKQYGGDIDKFVGDELVATFDDEGDHEDNMVLRAVRCAFAIQMRVHELNRQYPDADIGVGIGINSGLVVLGAMGSEERMDYTVLGDTVNTGARLCSAAGPFQIILSEESRSYLADREDVQLRELPPLSVKNKSEPLKVYEVSNVDLPE